MSAVLSSAMCQQECCLGSLRCLQVVNLTAWPPPCKGQQCQILSGPVSAGSCAAAAQGSSPCPGASWCRCVCVPPHQAVQHISSSQASSREPACTLKGYIPQACSLLQQQQRKHWYNQCSACAGEQGFGILHSNKLTLEPCADLLCHACGTWMPHLQDVIC